jgi:hypothetical protein
MSEERSVLVLDGGGAPRAALAHRVRRLGYRTVRAKSPEDAFRIVEDRRQQVGVALIPTDLAVVDLPAALAALAAAAGTRPAYVVTGPPPPSSEGRDELRAAGITLALFEPFEDARLRFQLNRALSLDDQGGLPRSEMRAPVEIAARVFQAGRQKTARTYTLSSGGVYLETLRPAMRGAALEVELPIGAGPIRLAGQVTHANVPGNLQRPNLPVGMGVRFDAVSEIAAQAIRRVVAQVALELSV